jgi:hypothetical protein
MYADVEYAILLDQPEDIIFSIAEKCTPIEVIILCKTCRKLRTLLRPTIVPTVAARLEEMMKKTFSRINDIINILHKPYAITGSTLLGALVGEHYNTDIDILVPTLPYRYIVPILKIPCVFETSSYNYDTTGSNVLKVYMHAPTTTQLPTEVATTKFKFLDLIHMRFEDVRAPKSLISHVHTSRFTHSMSMPAVDISICKNMFIVSETGIRLVINHPDDIQMRRFASTQPAANFPELRSGSTQPVGNFPELRSSSTVRPQTSSELNVHLERCRKFESRGFTRYV